MISLNLIDLDKPSKQEVAAFATADVGSDMSFFQMPEKAQQLAIKIIKECKTYNKIKRELDRSTEFRSAFHDILSHKGIDVFDMDFTLQAVDSVMRYWSWKYQGEMMA